MKRTHFYTLCLILLVLENTLCGNPWGKDADLALNGTCSKNQFLTASSCQNSDFSIKFGIKNQHPRSAASVSCQTPILGAFGEQLIAFHQNVISPADGPRSNFRPSSSQYMLDAMRMYGFFKGFAMGCDRLMRENADPWVYRTTINEAGERMKYDPVP